VPRAVGPETIFVSYAREDARFVGRLVADLRQNGIDVWVDSDIEAGAPWDQTIERAIRVAKRMIVVLSPRSIASNEVTNEWSFALDDKDVVVPVMLEACEVPFRLRRLRRVEFTRDYAAALSELLARLAPGRAITTEPVAMSDPPRGKRRAAIAVAVPIVAVMAFGVWRFGAGSGGERNAGMATPLPSAMPPSIASSDSPTKAAGPLPIVGNELIHQYRERKDSRSKFLSSKDRWVSAAESFEGVLGQSNLSEKDRARDVSSTRFCRGSEQILNGALEAAETQLREAIAADDGWAPPYIELAAVLTGLGRYAEAHDMARAAARVEPDLWLASVANASVFAAEGKMRDAIGIYEVVMMGTFEDLPLVQGGLALAYRAAGQHVPRAKRLAEEALRRDPELAPALTVLAEIALEDGDPTTARGYTQKLVDAPVVSVSAWLLHGDVLSVLGEKALARSAYERALSAPDRTRQTGASLARFEAVKSALAAGVLPPSRTKPRAAASGSPR
jgi:Tfp pilus assembly protein PilF